MARRLEQAEYGLSGIDGSDDYCTYATGRLRLLSAGKTNA